MTTFLILLAFGLLIVIMGVINMMGNLSPLHSYHYKRVKETDRKTFGRLVGIGTSLIGVSVIGYGVCFLLMEQTGSEDWVLGGIAGLLIGIFAGLGVTLYAMMKYNKGIF